MRCWWRKTRFQNHSTNVVQMSPTRRWQQNHPRRLQKCSPSLRNVYSKEEIKSVFQNFDLNGKGKLSKEEVEKAFAHLGSRWPKYRAWRGRIHADADKDGFISLGAELDYLVDYTRKLGYKP